MPVVTGTEPWGKGRGGEGGGVLLPEFSKGVNF
jgi:hypothetical protein